MSRSSSFISTNSNSPIHAYNKYLKQSTLEYKLQEDIKFNKRIIDEQGEVNTYILPAEELAKYQSITSQHNQSIIERGNIL